nr:hypothetical protein [Sulfobacillus harzensis]
MTAAASYALGALPLAYLLGIIVVALWINTPYQFSHKLASASGVAYFVEKGAGALWGYLAGLSYVVYYIALIPANALFFGTMVSALLPILGVAHPASWLWIPLSLLLLIPSTLLTYLGIKTSLNYAIFVALMEMVLLVVVSLSLSFRDTLTIPWPSTILILPAAGMGDSLLDSWSQPLGCPGRRRRFT